MANHERAPSLGGEIKNQDSKLDRLVMLAEKIERANEQVNKQVRAFQPGERAD